ncbi:MAG: hypothetical protein KatS3mg101_1014 [Patescibacteria group bacterium]|nr:MAG: hypothetical protein KatS3mg101_1014 [Patescibacteria group bacterium]
MSYIYINKKGEIKLRRGTKLWKQTLKKNWIKILHRRLETMPKEFKHDYTCPEKSKEKEIWLNLNLPIDKNKNGCNI